MILYRLDDACEWMDIQKWNRIEKLFDLYGVKPIVAIIPFCEDDSFTSKYTADSNFWEKAKKWQDKKWTIALHGYNHVYNNNSIVGLNPVNDFSEFVGLSYEEQKTKIKKGISIFTKHGLLPKCFVAPGHTFDQTTLDVLKKETNLRVVSDTIACDSYENNGLFFLPQQCGPFKSLPFKIVTCCIHPNTFTEQDFLRFESILNKKRKKIISYDDVIFKKRKISLFEKLLKYVYFRRKKARQ